jgi:2,3-bisphosphoglycerate-independent phosphoglycerate mutase
VFVHVFTDGRDASPTGSTRYIAQLEEVLRRTGGKIATVVGRYYAMDRDKRWDRTKLAYDAIVKGVAASASQSAAEAVRRSHGDNVTDEFIKPVVIVDASNAPVGTIRDGDSVLFFNFRADRARQMSRALALDDFDGFERPADRPHVHYTTMTVYDRTFTFPVVFQPQSLNGNFADVLEASGRGNLRLAETEKYAHVTYFFNCGREEPYRGEDRVLIPSQKVATYDLMPQMSAPGIADTLVNDIDRRTHDVVICNFANADMVGHTGNLDATIAAVQTLDECMGRILRALEKAGGTAIITADHGNAEQMWDDELNAPHTAHTANPVPVILCHERFVGRTLRDGTLRDVAPTMLELLGIEKSADMTGRSLLER